MVGDVIRGLGIEAARLRAAIKAYEYVAPRLSLLERLFLDRLWELIAKHVYPRWLAPNLITLLGGMCVVLAALLSTCYSPSLRGEAPSWVYGANALLLLCYQTLDGSDGKQARRTRTGSPLGELFDHGVDAWAVGLITMFTVDAFAYGIESPWPWLILLGAQICFFFSNMTLLHMGCMRVNTLDVIELQTAMYAALLITAVCGPGVWATRLPLGLPAIVHDGLGFDWRVGVPIRDVLAVWIVFVMFCNAAATTSAVGQHLARQSASARRRRPPCAGPMPMARQVAFLTAHVVLSLLSYRTAVRAVALHPTGQSTSPTERLLPLRLLLLLVTVGFAGDVAKLLAARVGHVPPPRISRCLGATFAFCLGVRLWGDRPGLDVHLFLFAIVCATAVDALRFFVLVASAVAEAVGLHPFRVRGAKHWYSLT